MFGRTLNDQELFELDQECSRRLTELQASGVQFGGVDTHYQQMLIEQLLGPAGVDAAREKHLLWLKAMLDDAEPKIRTARIMQGVSFGNGNPHGKS